MDKSESVTSTSVLDLTHLYSLCHMLINSQLLRVKLKNQDTYLIKIHAIVIYIEY